MTKAESSLVVSKYHLRKIRRESSVVWEAGKSHCLRGFGAAVLEYAGDGISQENISGMQEGVLFWLGPRVSVPLLQA